MNEFLFICARLILDERVLKILYVTERHIVMSKFQKQSLVKAPFHFVSQQKTRSSAAVFVALAVRPKQNNSFEIN